MRSKTRGKSISAVEIVNISGYAIWLHAQGKEYILPYEDYPWFKDATVGQIRRVRFLRGHHLHWPDLDVDLELESLKYPQKYPLIYK